MFTLIPTKANNIGISELKFGLVSGDNTCRCGIRANLILRCDVFYTVFDFCLSMMRITYFSAITAIILFNVPTRFFNIYIF